MLRPFLLLALAATTAFAVDITTAEGVAVTVNQPTRNYDAAADQTVFNYFIDIADAVSSAQLVVTTSGSCSLASSSPTATNGGTLGAITTGLQFAGTTPTDGRYTYQLVLDGNIPSGSSQVEFQLGSGSPTVVSNIDVPNCDGAHPKPQCDISLESEPNCVNYQGTAKLRSVHSAHTYQWAASMGTIALDTSANAELVFPVAECWSNIVVQLTVTSAEGSQTTCNNTVSFTYKNLLAFKSSPSNVVVDRNLIPAKPVLEVVDGLCFNTTVDYESTQTGIQVPYTITRTWTIKDYCRPQGVMVQQDIEVVDNVPPHFANHPSDVTVQCDAIPEPCEVAAHDEGSDADLLVGLTEVKTGIICPNSYTLTRTWTTKDESNNAANWTQVITVVDEKNPSLIGVPADISVECGSVPPMAIVTGKDTCDNQVNVNSTERSIPIGLVRTFTVSDTCGNDVTQDQTIRVNDFTAPRIVGVQNGTITVECDAVPATPCEVSAVDSCDASVEVVFEQTTEAGGCAANKTLFWTWTATDSSNNVATIKRTVIIQDTTGPEFHNLPSQDTLLTCNPSTIPDRVTAYDKCSFDADVDMIPETIPESENKYTLIRRYSSMDYCGNVNTGVHTIIVDDSTEPTLVGVPGDTTVHCDAVPPQSTNVLAYDNCVCGGTLDLVPNSYEKRIDDVCDDRYRLVRTWNVTDCTGNIATQDQTVTVVDVTPPVFSSVLDGVNVTSNSSHTQACDAIVDPTTTVHDACSGDRTATPLDTERIDGACDETYDLVYKWTSVDKCGNSIEEHVTINVVDDEMPTFDAANRASVEAAADLTVECNETVDIEYILPVAANDTCDSTLTVNRTRDVTRSVLCADETYDVLNKWSITDECGNDGGSIQQVIHVVDTQAPEFDNCTDQTVTLQYRDLIPQSPLITATDNCAAVNVVPSGDVYTGNSSDPTHRCAGSMTRTWDVQDNCGNSADTCTHTYIFVDETGPSFTEVPEDFTVDCNHEVDVANFSKPAGNYPFVVMGNHDDLSDITYSKTCAAKVGDLSKVNQYTQVCTFRATDNCQQLNEVAFTITVHDDVAPVFNETDIPDDITIECGDTIPSAPELTVVDKCDGTKTIQATSDSNAAVSGKVVEHLVYTWTATDVAGNVDTRTQTITIQDTTEPSITCPAGVDVECPHLIMNSTQATADDTCNRGNTVTNANPISTPQGIDSCTDYEYSITYTATDTVGNTNNCTVTYSVDDLSAPSCSAPASYTEECATGYDVVQANLTGCADNCLADVDVNMSSSDDLDSFLSPDGLKSVHNFYHAWTATDACGITTDYTQTVRIRDTTAPTFDNCPDDITVSCEIPDTPNVTASDTCEYDGSSVTVNHTDDRPAINERCGEFSFTHTWTATDIDDNSATCTQKVTVTGSRAMRWENGDPSFNELIEFGEKYPDWTTIDPINDCGTINVTCDDVVSINGTCDNESNHTRYCHAEETTYGCDPSGINYTQIIRVEDSTPNLSYNAGEDVVYDCNDNHTHQVPAAPGTTLSCTDGAKSCETCGSCYSFVRNCTETDDCGNSASDTYTVQIEDSQVPTIVPPVAVTIDCAEELPDVLPNVTDDCANLADGEDATIENGAINQLTVDDVTVRNQSDASTSDNVTGLVIRKFRYSDDCGNTATKRQSVTFIDTTPPTIDQCTNLNNVDQYPDVSDIENSGAVDGELGQEGYTWPAAGSCTCHTPPTDDCSTDAQIDLTCSESIVPGGCPNNFTRVYTWTATDAHGHTSSTTYSVAIVDTTPPTWDDVNDLPPHVTKDITDIPAWTEYTAPTVSDVGVNSTAQKVDLVLSGQYEYKTDVVDQENFKLVRVYNATDACGNTLAHEQTITVTSLNEDVVLRAELLPAAVTRSCSYTYSDDNIFNPEDVQAATNHWSDNDDIVYFENSTSAGSCKGEFSETWIWFGVRHENTTDTPMNHTVTFHTSDMVAPVFSGTPVSRTLNANATDCSVPPQTVLFATDACGTKSSATSFLALENRSWFAPENRTVVPTETRTNTTGNNYQLTRSWYTEDECGNNRTHSIVVTVQDVTPCSIKFSDENALESNNHTGCSAPTFSEVEAQDNCGTCNITYEDEEWISCPDYYYVRKWTATDENNLSTSMSQTFVYTDDVSPTWDDFLAEHETDRCNETIPTPVGSDVCGNVTAATFEDTPTDHYNFIRTWQIKDHCENPTYGLMTVTIVDYNAPNLTVPDSYHFTCGQTVPDSVATYTDDCKALGGTTLTPSEEEVAQCGSTKQIIRTWVASDTYQNVTKSQTIFIEDDGAPTVAQAPLDRTIDVSGTESCAPITSGDNLTASDCNVALDDVVPTVAQDGWNSILTWTVTDDCGNSHEQTQTITRDDTQKPVIHDVCADRYHKCATADGDEPANCTTISCSDNCDANGPDGTSCSLNYTETKIQEGDCGGNAYYVRVWNAQDEAGNLADTAYQTITLYDREVPTFSSQPADDTVECPNIPEPANITAYDSCNGDVDVTRNTSKIEGAPFEHPYVLVHTWTTSDHCGNVNIWSQSVTVEDNADPPAPAVPPQDINTECALANLQNPYEAANVTVTDVCAGDIVSVITSNTISADCPDTTEYTYTWTDTAGRTTEHKQTITYTDNTGPNITIDDVDLPLKVTECLAPASLPDVTADDTDGCNDIVGEIKYEVIPLNCTDAEPECVETYINKWSVSDSCGNPSEEFQTVMVKDTKPYNITSAPSSETVDFCNYDFDASHYPNPVANDECTGIASGQVTNSSVGDVCDANGMQVNYTYTWTDQVGHVTTGSHVITVKDTTNRTISTPYDDITRPDIECTDTTMTTLVEWLDGSYSKCIADGTESDKIVANVTTAAGSCDEEYFSIGHYATTDNCGTETSTTHSVTVVDTTPPYFNDEPADISAECQAVLPPQEITAEDVCAGVTVVNLDVTTTGGNCEHNYTIIRVWSTADNCGNNHSHTQTVSVYDTTDPVLSEVKDSSDCVDATVECNENVPVCDYEASDVCDSTVVRNFTETEITTDCINEYTLERSWDICDDCGHCAQKVQTIVVQDTTPPEIDGPDSVTTEYPHTPAVHPDKEDHTWSDNCDSAGRTPKDTNGTDPDATIDCDEVPSGNVCAKTYNRTCTVTDACGKSSSHSYTVLVEDTTPPSIFGVPDDFTVEKGELPVVPTDWDHVTAIDANGENVDLTVDDTPVDIEGGVKQVTWVYTATDTCDNAATQTVVITEVDNCPPTLNDYPADMTVECDAVPTACTLYAVNEPSINITFTEVTLISGVLSRTWSGKDASNNEVSHTQLITIEDTTSPILSRLPADQTVACSCHDFPVEEVHALDNCDTSANVSVTTATVAGSGPDDYSLIRTYTATDNQNNTVVHDQTITVEDNEFPAFFPVPAASMVVSCDEVTNDLIEGITAAETIGIDNCDDSPVVNVTTTRVNSTGEGSCADKYVLYRTFYVTDHNGQDQTVVSTIEVTDLEKPRVNSIERACVYQDNSAEFAFSELFASIDDCSSEPVLTFSHCNSTDASVTCVENGADGVDVTAGASNAVVQVYVTVADDCGNSQDAVATINSFDKATAAGGGYSCKSSAVGK